MAYRAYAPWIIVLLVVGCSDNGPPMTPPASASTRIDDLSADASSLLRELPHVATVSRHGPAGTPTHRIIHICNRHLVSLDDYLADLQSQSDEPISAGDMDRYQQRLIDEVTELQRQQVELLTALVKRHGLKHVHIEGFCIGQESAFERIVSKWTDTERRLVDLKADVAEFGDDERAKPLNKAIRDIEKELRLDKAHYGAAAQVYQQGALERVLPAEDATLLDAAKPIADDGTYREDQVAIEAREDFIVTTLLASGPVRLPCPPYDPLSCRIIPFLGDDPRPDLQCKIDHKVITLAPRVLDPLADGIAPDRAVDDEPIFLGIPRPL